MRRIAAFMIVLALSSNSHATTNCTREDAIKAETESGNITSWSALFQSFQAYHQCDDGAIAEGYNASVTKLLIDHWASFGEIQPFWSNEQFREFVKDHIGQTELGEDLAVALENLTKRCPSGFASICSELAARTSKEIKELENQ